jgi:hypothetical protein
MPRPVRGFLLLQTKNCPALPVGQTFALFLAGCAAPPDYNWLVDLATVAGFAMVTAHKLPPLATPIYRRKRLIISP